MALIQQNWLILRKLFQNAATSKSNAKFGVQCSEFAVQEAPPFCQRASLEVLLEVQHSDIQDGVLMVKFDRQEVIAYIEVVLKITPPEDVTLTVMGELRDGTRFEGSDTIRIIDPGSKKN